MSLLRSALPYSPEPLSTATDARDTAYAFGALYQHVLQSTVTREKVQIVPVQKRRWPDSEWILSAIDERKMPRAFELTDGTWLLAAQTVGVRQSTLDPANRWLTTLRYTYQWQAGEEDGSWLVRWCYRRETDQGELLPRELRAHVHVHATPEDYSLGKDFPKLHLPGGRVSIEELAYFLIGERGCPPVSDQWRDVIEEARGIFNKIQGRPESPGSAA